MRTCSRLPQRWQTGSGGEAQSLPAEVAVAGELQDDRAGERGSLLTFPCEVRFFILLGLELLVAFYLQPIFQLPLFLENNTSADGNHKTNSVYQGKHPWSGFKPQRCYELPGHPLPSNDPSKATYGVVNPDLVNICGLPVENATYTVYATFGEYKSNVLTIKTVVK